MGRFRIGQRLTEYSSHGIIGRYLYFGPLVPGSHRIIVDLVELCADDAVTDPGAGLRPVVSDWSGFTRILGP